jgi:D-tyrosyl-tRNA(Tyr) deacylase
MRAVIQRVKEASVTIKEIVKGTISQGLLIYLGIIEDDTQDDIEWLTSKIINLRIFSDEHQLMNLSLLDVEGEALVISQFTLHAKTKKGHRPSFSRAAGPEAAVPLYEEFIRVLDSKVSKPVQSGEFGADMQVQSVNDGPVTIIIDTKQKE